MRTIRFIIGFSLIGACAILGYLGWQHHVPADAGWAMVTFVLGAIILPTPRFTTTGRH